MITVILTVIPECVIQTPLRVKLACELHQIHRHNIWVLFFIKHQYLSSVSGDGHLLWCRCSVIIAISLIGTCFSRWMFIFFSRVSVTTSSRRWPWMMWRSAIQPHLWRWTHYCVFSWYHHWRLSRHSVRVTVHHLLIVFHVLALPVGAFLLEPHLLA